MKRYFSALILGLLSLTSQLAHADVIDDAIGNRRSTMLITPTAAVMTTTIATIAAVKATAVSTTIAVGSSKTDAAV